MRRVVPAVLAFAVLAVVAGVVLDRDEPTPRTDGGWTPVLVPRPTEQHGPEPIPPARVSDHVPRAHLLPPATGPARVYPL